VKSVLTIPRNAQSDFQKLTDEAFHELRQKYFSPADLVAEMAARRSSNRKPKSAMRLRAKLHQNT
jgi:hypothetical protein